MKNIIIMGPSFSGKSELAKTLSILEPKAEVLNIKNICTYYAIKNGANADVVSKNFTSSEVNAAVSDYISTHNINKDNPFIWDGLSKDNLKECLLSPDFKNESVVVLIKKLTDEGVVNATEYKDIAKMIFDANMPYISLEFTNNKLSLPNIFK